jgi:hypothetical protein
VANQFNCFDNVQLFWARASRGHLSFSYWPFGPQRDPESKPLPQLCTGCGSRWDPPPASEPRVFTSILVHSHARALRATASLRHCVASLAPRFARRAKRGPIGTASMWVPMGPTDNGA